MSICIHNIKTRDVISKGTIMKGKGLYKLEVKTLACLKSTLLLEIYHYPMKNIFFSIGDWDMGQNALKGATNITLH